MNEPLPQHDDLVRAVARRKLLVVVGPLVREAAGLVGPRKLVEKGLEVEGFSDEARRDIRVLAGRGQYAAALELIKSRLGPRFFSVYEPLLAGERPTPPASLRALALLASSLPQVLTTNLDNLVELAMPGRWAPLAEVTADLASRGEVVFKMLGDARHFTTWRFTQDGLKNATYLAPHFQTEVGALLRGHQLLFIGYRGDDELLDELLRLRAHAPKDLNTPQWVALVPPGGLEKREHYGKVGLQLVVLDVPADDPVAYDGAVAEFLKELARAGPAVSIEPMVLPDQQLTGNPYPGLVPFSEVQAGQFFGREDDCRTLVGKLGTCPMGHTRWLMLTGPSGVGKSSLLAAGLVPAVRASAPPVAGAPTQWCVVLLRPGRELLRNLATVVRDSLAIAGQPVAPESLTREHFLARDRALTDFLAARLQGRGFLLVLDQFEEAFTVGVTEDRPYLDALLVRGLQDLEVPFYLVTAIRSDYVGDFGRHFPLLAEQLNRGSLSARHDLAPLRVHGLRDAVVRPAELAGRVFEAGLVDRILREAGAVQHGEIGEADAPDATLPLVAHVLHALVEREPARVLSLRAYEALGGVAKALTRSADALLVSLRHEFPETQIRNLLVALVELQPQGRDTRRVLSRTAALSAAGGDTDDIIARSKAEAMLLRLSGGTTGGQRNALPVRLIAVRGEGESATVDIVHDALLREWSTLRDWLGEDRETQLLHRELTRATDAWIRQNRSVDELWRGNRIVRSTATLTGARLDLNEQRFLEASENRENRRRRIVRTIIAIMACGLIALAAISIYALRQRDEARTQIQIANGRMAAGIALLQEVLFESLPRLKAIPGTTTVQYEIHSRLEVMRKALYQNALENPDAQRVEIIRRIELADFAMSFGHITAAKAEYMRAISIAADVKNGSDDPEVQTNLSVALGGFGMAYERTGELALAQYYFTEALRVAALQMIRDPLQPINAENGAGFALALGRLGLSTGDFEQARAHVERATEIIDFLLRVATPSSKIEEMSATSFEMLGDIELRLGNVPNARAQFTRSLGIRENVAKRDPHIESQLNVIDSLDKLGGLELSDHKLDDARQYFDRALKLAESMSQADPSNHTVLHVLAIAHFKIAEVEQWSGNTEEARRRAKIALQIIEDLAEFDDDNAIFMHGIAMVLNRLGDYSLSKDQYEEAKGYRQKTYEIMVELTSRAPENAEWRRDLAAAAENLGIVELYTGNLAIARARIEDGFRIATSLVAIEKGNMRFRMKLCLSNDSMGEVENASGNVNGARQYYENALSLARSMLEDAPSDGEVKLNVMMRHFRLALFARVNEDAFRASENIEAASNLLDELEQSGRADVTSLAGSFRAEVRNFREGKTPPKQFQFSRIP